MIKNILKKIKNRFFANEIAHINRLQQHVNQLDFILQNMYKNPDLLWLYANKSERMDALKPIFNAQRAKFHTDRYRFCLPYIENSHTVLDAATGTGYGTSILMDKNPKKIIGIDIDPKTIAYAQAEYADNRVEFVCASADKLPIIDGFFDVVVSFETLEHLPDEHAFLSELKRVMKPHATLIISTPNDWALADAEFHLKEYDYKGFEAVLRQYFDDITIYNQNSGTGYKYNRNQAAGIIPTNAQNAHLAECFIAVCRR